MDHAALLDQIDAIVAPHVKPGGPGLVVGLARHGTVLARKAYGHAHIELGVAMTCETVFPIASITKQMTSLCALVLQEEGLLDIDAPIGNWVPELPEAARVPTLRQLMQHVSGLRCYVDAAGMDALAPRPDGYGLETLKGITSIAAPPGAWQVYNNSGHMLTSLAIERAAGAPFEDVMQSRVFGPLEMTRTRLVRTIKTLIPGAASLYLPASETEWQNSSSFRSEILGDGGVYSTLDDMLIWAKALRTQDPRIGTALWQELKVPAVLADGSRSGYGLGLMLETKRGIECIGHGGALAGLLTYMTTAAESGIDVVVMANQMVRSDAVADAIIAAVLGEAALLPEPAAAKAADHQDLIGPLFVSEDCIASFADAGGMLALAMNGNPPAPLQVAADGTADFTLPTPIGPVLVSIIEDGIRIRAGGERHDCTRIIAPTPGIADIASGVAGQYACAETGGTFVIATGEDQFTVAARGRWGWSNYVARPVAPDLLSLSDPAMPLMGGAYLRLVRDGDAVTGVLLETGRTRHLHFAKV